MRDFDVLVLGSGPGGQKAAIAAAKLDRRVAVVERRHMIGGGRVAAAHCCAAAPSEPDVPLVAASGSSKPHGRFGFIAASESLPWAPMCAVDR